MDSKINIEALQYVLNKYSLATEIRVSRVFNIPSDRYISWLEICFKDRDSITFQVMDSGELKKD